MGWTTALVLVGSAVFADASASPWVRAGARSWRPCLEAASEARVGRFDAISEHPTAPGRGWRRLADRCPGEPWVRLGAALEGFVELTSVQWGNDVVADLGRVDELHRRILEDILGHLEAAKSESERRAEPGPRRLDELLVRAHLALGHLASAKEAWARAAEDRSAPRWELDRIAALVDMMEGRLPQSVRRARLSWTDIAHEERLVSGYVWALVLDRAGALGAAQDALEALRREPSHVIARREVELLLPLHERLYLQALERQAEDARGSAIPLWQAYLSRPEPSDAERVLAARHLAELLPSP